MRSSDRGVAASAGASQTRNDALERGACGGASLLRNGGVLRPDGFGRRPLDTDFVGWGGLVEVVMVDVGEEQNETSVCDEDCDGSVAGVLASSCKGGGSCFDGRGPVRVEEVKTGEVVGEAEVNVLSAALVGPAWTGGSGRSAAPAALDMLDTPQKLCAPRTPFAPGRLGAPGTLSVPCRLDAAPVLFVPGRPDVAHRPVFLGKPAALGTFDAPQRLFAPRKLSALRKFASLCIFSPERPAVPADHGRVVVPRRPCAPHKPASPYILVAPGMLLALVW